MPSTIEAERAWLERELQELHAREAQYRARLGKHETLSTRLRAYSKSLHQLLRRHPPTRAELSRILVDVARLSARALRVKRASVWLFDSTRESLHCTVELVGDRQIPPTRVTLNKSELPSYLKALSEETAVAVSDARNDPRTVELSNYLIEHDVYGLLDIPIMIPGDFLGIVCHEHVGSAREWRVEEVDFASTVGHLITIALETERRIAAEYLVRGTEAKYRHLVESLPCTVYSFDVHTGELDYVSPRMFDLEGFSVGDLLAEGVEAWVERIHPDDRKPVLLRLESGVAAGFPEEATYRIRLPNGVVRWIRDNCSVVRDESGRPVAVQGVLADVTDQREAEASRREFERRYRALLENVDLVAVTLDANGQTTFVNDAFVRLSGYDRSELLGADWFEKMIPEPERDVVRQRFLADVRTASIVPRFELQIRTRSGDKRQILCTNTMLRDADGVVQGTSSLALDVTNRRILETELLHQTRLESLGRLAAGVAHDFNNLLTILMGEVSLLKRNDGSVNMDQALKVMDDALEQASELTRSLLVYGRKSPNRRECVIVDEFVEETIPLLEAMTRSSASLSVSLRASGACVKCDRTNLRQVLVNLVSNAADAAEGTGAGVRIATHVELVDETDARKKGARAGGDYLVLSVSDDGKGMDTRTLERIFEPFYTTKREGKGTGLGLAISQTIVNESGGFIVVESEPGQGTTFRVYLPGSDVSPVSVIPSSREYRATQRKRVLVVDDLVEIQNFVTRSLESAGYDVVAVEDIKSAARVLASTEVDLLLTDVRLPDGSGTVLGRSLRIIKPDMRVVLMSGSGAIEESFDGHLEKPFDAGSLLTVVEGAIGAGPS